MMMMIVVVGYHRANITIAVFYSFLAVFLEAVPEKCPSLFCKAVIVI